MKSPNTLINYVEFKTKDISKIKEFYTFAFGWKFTDYGPTYTAFENSGIEGGFRTIEEGEEIVNGVLVVLYHEDLAAIKDQVLKFGGTLVQDIFSFPGGRRFHFLDPSGNELAIWSDK
ncbi:VOC family protein [Flagellimonas meishanensis]|uniref:VOC family protein n=1 Tax=Flagellimonas meishanensis TaxID=2873264 RepID=UPI001CA6AC18|nr:VOC family protein [[Muricauda] meishanensis]